MARGIITARVLIEGDERTRSFVVSALKSSCRNIRDGTAVAIGLFDEDGKSLGVDISGSPSTEMQDLIEEIFDPDHDAVA